MNFRIPQIVTVIALLFAAPVTIAATTLIHAGELLAVPGESIKRSQTIVLEDDRVLEVRDGFTDASEFPTTTNH